MNTHQQVYLANCVAHSTEGILAIGITLEGIRRWLLSQFADLPVIGGKDCEAVTQTPKHEETFKIGESISVKALHTPCHTQDSICWLMEDGNDRIVFTGDTLFIGGCGRFFEGTPAEMHTALNKTLAALPSDTKVYPGHEYTNQNVKFLTTVLQTEPVMKLQSFAENNKETQGKFTIGDEKQYNVFMKLDDPTVQKATGKTDPVDVMSKLREMKNNM
ncbi:Cytoplasmic glyoxalase II [Bachmanniomyces sp. S44760]|nr:Cytoplasmic glyoxalase II [Bachmanniomyces sp. S44760]